MGRGGGRVGLGLGSVSHGYFSNYIYNYNIKHNDKQ